MKPQLSGLLMFAALSGANGAWAGATPSVPTEICANTSFTALAASDCRGAFGGAIAGQATEASYLGAQWGGAWAYVGASDDGAGHGPFTGNPQVDYAGTLVFDAPVAGRFVIGLEAANQHSYYLFNSVNAVASVTFDSTEGVATTPQGNAMLLTHATFYRAAAPVPEPGMATMLLAGLAVLGLRRRQRLR